MITCFIRYEIDPFAKPDFEKYARNWGQAIPRCGADLIGYYAPHEGSATAYAVYNIENLAAYEPIAPALPPILWVKPITTSPGKDASFSRRTGFSSAMFPDPMRNGTSHDRGGL